MALQPDSSRQRIHQRLSLLYVPIILVFVVIAARLWQLQIIDGREYTLKAERNRIRTIPVVAPRGTILDRFGKPLVENRSSFNILLYRESIRDLAATTSYIVDKLGVGSEDLAARLRRNKESGPYRPIVIKEDIGIDDISVVEAHKRDHPEIQLGPEPRRFYKYRNLAAQVLGYVGEVSEEELARETSGSVKAGDLVGKSGIERTYNQYLTGKDGKRQVLVDSVGREMGLLDEVDAVSGGELKLTLDLELQTTAENLLAGKVGAILAIDPRNGEILTMASAPSFDPNSFSARISRDDWSELVNDSNHPLQNRAIQNSYSPGSIFKLIMAEAGLEEGVVQDDTRVVCTGSAMFYGRLFHCAQHNGHGTMNLEQAITRSCNIFFYELGRKMGISKIAEHAQALGLGEPTGIDLPGERIGTMPSPEWKQRVRHSKWFAGETISVSIGQGAVSVTPLQILRAVSAIATGGKLTTPHVFRSAERSLEETSNWAERILPISSESTRRIKAGMWGSVNSFGTGHNAFIPGLDICGKTGTVQVIGNERKQDVRDKSVVEDHAWFAGFASRDNPEIAVVVFLEHGGKGGLAAAPLAREIFRTFYRKTLRPELVTQLTPKSAAVAR